MGSIAGARRAGQVNKVVARLLADLGQANTDALVEAVNSKLMLSHFAIGETKQYRLEAGRILLELYKRKMAEGVDWWPWAKANVQYRSRQDIHKLIKIASSDDPEAAARYEREQNRKYKADQRAKAVADVSDNIVRFPRRHRKSKVAYLFQLIEALSDAEQDELRELCTEKLSWLKEYSPNQSRC